MKNEPDIVKELKKEEQNGALKKCYSNLYESYNIKPNKIADNSKEILKDLDNNTCIDNIDDFYKIIAEKTSDLIAIVDFKLRPKYLYVSPSHKKYLGYESKDLIGESFFDYIHPGDKKRLLPILKKYLKIKAKKMFFLDQQKYVENFEYRIKDKQGNWHYLTSTVNLYGDKVIAVSKDVTEKKKTEIKLKQSEKRFRDLVDNANDLIQSVRPDGSIIFVNKFWKNTLGYSKHDISNMNIFEIIHPDSKKHCKEVFKEVLSGKNIDFVEASFISKNGKKIDVQGNINCRFEDGKPVATRGIFIDITEKKRLNRKLKENEKRFRSFFETSPDYCYMISSDGKILDINNSALEILGCKKEEIIGKQIIPTVYPNSKDRAKKLVKKWLKEGSLRNEEIGITTKYGERIVILSVDDVEEDGRLLYSILMQKDITDRKKAQEETNKILNAAADGIRIVDKDHNIKKINKTLAKMCSIDQKNAVGKKCKDVLRSSKCNTEDCALKTVLRTGKGFHREQLMRTTDGKKIPCLLSAKPYKNSQGQIIGIIEDYRDITEIKEKNKIVKDAKEKLEELNKNLEEKVQLRTKKIKHLLKQKDEFITQLGHDLKTPITPITTLLPLVKKNVSDKKTKEMLDVAINNSKYMKNLVEKTLKLAKLNSPNQNIILEKINLLDEINNVLKNKKIVLEKENIDVYNNVSENIYVKTDKIQLKELFDNILSNAIKYIDREKGRVVISTKEKDDFVDIKISDNGIGLSEEQIEKIFDEFYKADESRHNIESTGLGLAISKRIIDNLDGKIWVESEGIGKGSTFHIKLNKYDLD